MLVVLATRPGWVTVSVAVLSRCPFRCWICACWGVLFLWITGGCPQMHTPGVRPSASSSKYCQGIFSPGLVGIRVIPPLSGARMSVVRGTLDGMSIPFRPGTRQHRLLDAVVSRVAGIERELRRLEAERLAALARVREIARDEAETARREAAAEGRALGCEHETLVHRAAEAEVAFGVGVSDRGAARLLDHADRIVTDYPAVHGALADGRISVAHTRGIADAGTILPDREARRGYEAEVLAYAERESVNRTRKIARVLAEKHAHRTFEERHQVAREQRLVQVTDLGDGMAQLRAVLEATSAHAVYDRLCRQARAVQGAERDAAAKAKQAAAAATKTAAGAATGALVDIPGVRPLDHIRADLAADLLLNGAPSNGLGEIDFSGIQARVQVTVPVLSLLSERAGRIGAAGGGVAGTGETSDTSETDDTSTTTADTSAADTSAADKGAAEDTTAEDTAGTYRYLRIAGLQGAATLAGYGPIDTATARLLAGLSAGWERISCHPVTGDVLQVDRYRPSQEIRRFIIARDQQCRFYGCTVVAHRADQDHTVDAAHGGATSTANLAVLCRRHHVMKHHTGIQVTQTGGGVLEWVTGLGRRYRDVPVSRVMFRPIQEPEPEPYPEPPPAAGARGTTLPRPSPESLPF